MRQGFAANRSDDVPALLQAHGLQRALCFHRSGNGFFEIVKDALIALALTTRRRRDNRRRRATCHEISHHLLDHRLDLHFV